MDVDAFIWEVHGWPLESQKRLKSAKVLLIGLGDFGTEIARIVILAEVTSITLLDHRNMTEKDNCQQFGTIDYQLGESRAEVALFRLKDLNSMTNVEADTTNIDDKPDEYFNNFDVVCATECTITQLIRINRVCRKYKAKFFAGDVWGKFRYTFADLDKHEYVQEVISWKAVNSAAAGEPEREKKMESTVFIQKSTDIFTPFESAIDIDTSRIPAEKVKLYYIMMIMLHYREKYKCDPLSSERDSEKLKAEVAAIVEKYQLGDKLDTLIERSNLYDRDRVGSLFIGRVMSKEILQAVAQQNKPYNNTFLYNPRMSTYEVLKLVSQS